MIAPVQPNPTITASLMRHYAIGHGFNLSGHPGRLAGTGSSGRTARPNRKNIPHACFRRIIADRQLSVLQLADHGVFGVVAIREGSTVFDPNRLIHGGQRGAIEFAQATSARAGWVISPDTAAIAGAAASTRPRKARRDGEIPIGRIMCSSAIRAT
ncbi:MAG: hypothetical protein ACXWKP_23940 [Bradyrhizobium sp.]